VLLALVLPSMRETVLVSVLDLLLQLLLVQLKEAVTRVPCGIISRLLGNWVHAPLNEPLELVLLLTRGNTGGNTDGGSIGGGGFFSVAAPLLLLSMAFVLKLAVLRWRLTSSGYAAGLSPALSGARAPPLKTPQLDANDADHSEPFQVFACIPDGTTAVMTCPGAVETPIGQVLDWISAEVCCREGRLTYGGKKLERRSKTLADYSIQKESTCFFSGKSLGGARYAEARADAPAAADADAPADAPAAFAAAVVAAAEAAAAAVATAAAAVAAAALLEKRKRCDSFYALKRYEVPLIGRR
jgi:hypothetical protein